MEGSRNDAGQDPPEEGPRIVYRKLAPDQDPNFQPQQQTPQYQQPIQHQVNQQPQWQPIPQPPNKKRNDMIIAAAILIVIVIIGAYFALSFVGILQDNDAEEKKTITNGDYIVYDADFINGGTSYDGELTLSFTDVTAISYTMNYRMEVNGAVIEDSFVIEAGSDDWDDLSDVVLENDNSNAQFIGERQVSTGMGIVTCDLYKDVTGETAVLETYYSVTSGFPVKFVYDYYDGRYLELVLQETSIDWLV